MTISSSQLSSPERRHQHRSSGGSVDRLFMPLLTIILLIRVLTDDLSAANSRHSGSLNLSGGIAALLILTAGGLLIRRRHGLIATVLCILWLCVWTLIAISTDGASAETIREGVREASVVALAVIICNSRGAVTLPGAVRIVQFLAFFPAILALYQVASHTGMDVAGYLRANGTFAHPNSAVMFFGLAATVSLWRYLDCGRHISDTLLVTLFSVAVVATFSVDGLATLLAMLVAFGVIRSGTVGGKLVPCAVGVLAVLTFFATPIGSERIANESSVSLAATASGEPSTSLAWRFKKWKSLIPQWEDSPVFGRGLGTTLTAEGTTANPFAGYPPHNEYVRYLVETGVVGLASLLCALALLIRRLDRKRRSPGTVGSGAANGATLAIVIIVGCLVNSLADNTLLDSPTCYAATLIIVAFLSSPGVGVARARSPRLA
jgi:O-antigen ligase